MLVCACFALRGSVLSALLRRFLGRISCCDRSSLSPLSPWSCSRAVVHSSRVRRCTRRALLRPSASRRFSAPSRLIVVRSLLVRRLCVCQFVHSSVCPSVNLPTCLCLLYFGLFVHLCAICPSVGPRSSFVHVVRLLLCCGGCFASSPSLPLPSNAHIDQFVANLFGRLFDRTVDIFVKNASDRGRARA